MGTGTANTELRLLELHSGAAEGPPPKLLNVVLVSKCLQLAMFSLFFRLSSFVLNLLHYPICSAAHGVSVLTVHADFISMA